MVLTKPKLNTSFYKMRMHKGFLKKLIDKNFHTILSHMESQLSKNVFLKEINAEITDLDLRILPKGG